MKNNIPNFLTEFSEYLYVIKNFSNIYIKNLLVTLKQFLEFINAHKFHHKYNSIEEIDLNDIRALANSDIYSFIYFLAENHYKTNSRILKMEHLRNFFDYLFRIKHNVFKEPFKNIKREKKYARLPNYLSLEEAKNILKLYSNSKKVKEIRDNAILHLFLTSGLRASELTNLSIEDFNFEENTFLILGKGDKERVGYLNSSTKDALLKYIEVRKNIKAKNRKNEKYLFLSNKREKIHTTTLERAIKKAYKKIGIDYNLYSVHTLRHTCATIMYRTGVDIKIIQEILGHVQIDTTEIYTHLYDKDVEKAMLEHPLSQFKISDALLYCSQLAG